MTYGIPYTVHGWGDEIVTTVQTITREEVEGFTAVVRGTEPGPVILVPTSALTPVDTTPPEPEPGAYRLVNLDTGNFWTALRCADSWTAGGEDWREWREFWSRWGGPSVIIVRLAPEPAPVELPWRGRGLGGVPSRFATVDTTVDAEGVRAAVGDRLTACCVEMSHSDALAMAAALISAARAAREATP